MIAPPSSRLRQLVDHHLDGSLTRVEMAELEDQLRTPEAMDYYLQATEIEWRMLDLGVQLHGGAGYMAEYAVERFYRDVRLFRIYEGTTQIQQIVIARESQRPIVLGKGGSRIKAIGEAAEEGDLKENAEYHAAKERQAFIESRAAELENKISRAQVIDTTTLSGNTVKFGALVTVVDEDIDEEKTYQIVGEPEADIDNGKLNMRSPLARGLIGTSHFEDGIAHRQFLPGCCQTSLHHQ